MDNRCEKCGHTFSNRSNYLKHINTSQKCFQEKKRIKCDYCSKTYTQTTSLQRHIKICPGKPLYEEKRKVKKLEKELVKAKKEIREIKKNAMRLEKINRELMKDLDEHKGIVKGMEKAPEKKTIYNTAYVHPKLINLPVNNVPALTHEYVIEKVNNGILTYEKATKGYRGILEVICDLITHENGEGVIERNYVCTDVSRNSFHMLLESKKWKADKGGRYLNNILDTFRDVMQKHKNKAYDIYDKTSHDSFEWGQVDWERKNVSLLYSGIVCKEGSSSREELVNILRKEISKRASV